MKLTFRELSTELKDKLLDLIPNLEYGKLVVTQNHKQVFYRKDIGFDFLGCEFCI
jgi:hypothetical protein